MRHGLVLSFLAVACTGEATDDAMGGTTSATLDCVIDEPLDDYAPGLAKEGAIYTIAMVEADPDPPDVGINGWLLEVTDASGTPATGLSALVEPDMPQHGHGTAPPTFSGAEESEGLYRIDDVDLFMPGYWRLRFRVDDGTATDEVVYRFCLEG